MPDVTIRWFATLAETTGRTDETVAVDSGADVSVLWASLTDRYPALRDLGFRPLVACDREYAGWDRTLDGVSEIAFLPPISGG